jgi:L-rhamnose 1-dehydrogenase
VTGICGSGLHGCTGENKRNSMLGRIPAGRLGQPEDPAGPVVFLASEEAAYVNGAELLADGDLFMNLQ